MGLSSLTFFGFRTAYFAFFLLGNLLIFDIISSYLFVKQIFLVSLLKSLITVLIMVHIKRHPFIVGLVGVTFNCWNGVKLIKNLTFFLDV
jgi:hypothetical protein